MSKVFSAHAVSVDGYITGRNPGAGRGLGDGTTLPEVPHGGYRNGLIEMGGAQTPGLSRGDSVSISDGQ
ncbi:hypothetical protein [Micromonospora sp. NPDC005806]|uniref:hypothetical protein n=1 Tax=Micromonospora sp. NPDC005806 TaxID=3364234 RepID=UPI0036BDB91D